MKKTLTCLLMLALNLPAIIGLAQNVAINEDGSAPNPNAILDVKSFTKGVLIPRVSTSGRLAIPNTKGLLVYDTTAGTFWYNNGTAWQSLATSGAGWLLAGNSGTDATNYLGTADNMPLAIKVNNQPSGRIESAFSGNTFWGYNTGAANKGWGNTATGQYALTANTSGGGNTAIGLYALTANTTAYGNTAIGCYSLYNDSTGFSNTAGGGYSLYANTTGAYNTAYGSLSMYNNTTGEDNTATGASALYYNITGESNTAGGHAALFHNTTGTGNTAIGDNALSNQTTGNANTAVGNNALTGDTTGSYNTAIGVSANVGSGSLTNATVIGYSAFVNASNKVRIGNAAVTVIEGQVPFTTPSDGRFKYEVKEDVKGLDFILQLRPVTYRFDTKRFDLQKGNPTAGGQPATAGWAQQAGYDASELIRRSGFIAQEVEKAADASGYNFSGIIKPKTEQEHYSLSYESFVVPLVKGMQEQQKIIDTQINKIEQQEKQLKELRQELDEVKQLLQHAK